MDWGGTKVDIPPLVHGYWDRGDQLQYDPRMRSKLIGVRPRELVIHAGNINIGY